MMTWSNLALWLWHVKYQGNIIRHIAPDMSPSTLWPLVLMNARVFLQEKKNLWTGSYMVFICKAEITKSLPFIIMALNWWAELGFRASILRWFYEKKDTSLWQEQLAQISFAFSQGNNYCRVCWHFRLVPEHHFGDDPMSYDGYAPKIPGLLPNTCVHPLSSDIYTGMGVPISPQYINQYRKKYKRLREIILGWHGLFTHGVFPLRQLWLNWRMYTIYNFGLWAWWV